MGRPLRARGVAFLALVTALAVTSCAGGSASGSPTTQSRQSEASHATTAASPRSSFNPTEPTVVAKGTFHAVDGTVSGTAILIHHPKGTFYVTLEFFCGGTPSEHIVIVPATDVTSDQDVDQAALVDLGALRAMCGGVNQFPLPANADPAAFHTVVLWDPGVAHAIAAAPLR